MLKNIVNFFNDKLFILILAIIYFSYDSFLFGVNSDNNYYMIQYVSLIIVFLALLLKQIIKKTINKKLLYIYFFVATILLLSCIYNYDSFVKYLYQIFIIGIAVLLINLFDYKLIFKKSLKAITFLAVISWVPFLTNILFPQLIKHFPIVENTANWRFYNMFIGVAPCNELYHSIYRNYSIFREPGVFSVFILFALIILLFFMKDDDIKTKSKIKYTIILSLTMISTLSTGGMICYMSIISVYLLAKKISKEKLILFTILILAGLYIIYFTNIPYRIFGKLFVEYDPSTMSRLNSIKTNLMIFFDNPIFGRGWGQIDSEFQRISIQLLGSSIKYGEMTYHNTNTVLRILSTHGIFFFLIYLIGMFKTYSLITKNTLINTMLLLVFIIMISNENLTLNCFIYMVVFCGIKYAGGRKTNENSCN